MRSDDARWMTTSQTHVATPVYHGRRVKRSVGVPQWLTILEPVLAAVVACAAAYTGLAGFVPGLGLLRGPLGGVLIATGCLWAAAKALDFPRRLVVPPRVLFGISLVCHLGLGLHYASSLRVSGDEPHYLLMAQSLWREGDLDLRDNIAREDFKEYTPGPLAPHFGAPRSDGTPFPAHSPGLPLLLAPVYAVGGRLACVGLLGLMATLLGLETYRMARPLVGDEGASIAWILAAGPPVLFYSFHIYTEVPSALALCVALRLLLGAPRPAGAAVSALMVCALPWLHVKMIPAAAALGVVAWARLRGRARMAFWAVSALGACAFLGCTWSVFGTPLPTAIYGGVPSDLALGSVPRAPVGLLLDRSFGLLPYAPAFLVALAGLPAFVRRGPWPYVLVGVALLLPILTWRMWWGGQCPPGRFLVPMIPFLSLAAGRRWVENRHGVARWLPGLVLLGAGLAVFMAARPGDLLLLNRGDRPTRVWTALSGDGTLGRYLPSLTLPHDGETRTAALWLGALALIMFLDRSAERSHRARRVLASLTPAVIALVGLMALVDVWAKAEAVEGPRPVASRMPASQDCEAPGRL